MCVLNVSRNVDTMSGNVPGGRASGNSNNNNNNNSGGGGGGSGSGSKSTGRHPNQSGPSAMESEEEKDCGDEADLLALLKRLGLARSPSSKGSKGGGGGARGGGGTGGNANSSGSDIARTDNKPTTPAPTNGSQPPYGSFGNNPGGPAAGSITGGSSQQSGTAAAAAARNAGIKIVGRNSNNPHNHNGHERSQSDGVVSPGNRYPHRHGGGIGSGSDDRARQLHAGLHGAMSPTPAGSDARGRAGSGAPAPAPAGRVTGGPAVGGGLGMAAAAAATATEDGMVDLMRREITAREALLLGPILWAATGVTCLKLCYNHLKDGGAEAVSGAIQRHPSLHTMDLGKNTREGVERDVASTLVLLS